MIGTELLKGQGLGNQLFCYVTTRCIAMDNGLPFSILGGETVANNIHSNCGMYFMNLDYGLPSVKEDYTQVYYEREDRIFMGSCRHDLEHGCYVTGLDEAMLHPADNILLMGNMQDERYYIRHKEEIRQWLKVREEYDCMEYSRENLCVLHLRCSDYLDEPALYLRKKYWTDGIRNMRKLNPNMEFMIITNDVKEAGKILPGIPAYNFDLAKDYSILKNARYLLLSNSSFAYFPAFTSTTVQYILAPKYWARHNVSDGYWASEQNIYEGWHYQDRSGAVFTAQECREELQKYKQTSARYLNRNHRPEGLTLKKEELRSKVHYAKHRCMRLARGGKRRIGLLFKHQSGK